MAAKWLVSEPVSSIGSGDSVLALTNMSGDPEQEYFFDGIADDIITELSRGRSLFVIAGNSGFIYRRRTVDVKQVTRELGVRFVLEGSVRRSVCRVRVAAQLVDAETGNNGSPWFWPENHEHMLDGLRKAGWRGRLAQVFLRTRHAIATKLLYRR